MVSRSPTPTSTSQSTAIQWTHIHQLRSRCPPVNLYLLQSRCWSMYVVGIRPYSQRFPIVDCKTMNMVWFFNILDVELICIWVDCIVAQIIWFPPVNQFPSRFLTVNIYLSEQIIEQLKSNMLMWYFSWGVEAPPPITNIGMHPYLQSILSKILHNSLLSSLVNWRALYHLNGGHRSVSYLCEGLCLVCIFQFQTTPSWSIPCNGVSSVDVIYDA